MVSMTVFQMEKWDGLQNQKPHLRGLFFPIQSILPSEVYVLILCSRCPSDPNQCIPMEWFCDGIYDCPDWEDEDLSMCNEV